MSIKITIYKCHNREDKANWYYPTKEEAEENIKYNLKYNKHIFEPDSFQVTQIDLESIDDICDMINWS